MAVTNTVDTVSGACTLKSHNIKDKKVPKQVLWGELKCQTYVVCSVCSCSASPAVKTVGSGSSWMVSRPVIWACIPAFLFDFLVCTIDGRISASTFSTNVVKVSPSGIPRVPTRFFRAWAKVSLRRCGGTKPARLETCTQFRKVNTCAIPLIIQNFTE